MRTGFFVNAYVLWLLAGMAAVCLHHACSEGATAQTGMEHGEEADGNAVEGPHMDRRFKLIPSPTREKEYMFYSGRGDSFNLNGSFVLSGIHPGKVWEYKTADGNRAVAIHDGASDTYIVVFFKDFQEGVRTIDLAEKDGLTTAWLLRHDLERRDREAYVEAFIANPDASAFAYRLKGTISIRMVDGHFNRLLLPKVETRDPVSLNEARLKSRIESLRQDIGKYRKQLAHDPDNRLLQYNLRYAETSMTRIEDILASDAALPAAFIKARIDARWMSKSPFRGIFP